MIKLIDLLSEEHDYRGKHEAPGKDNGAPLHDLTKIYPDDIYSTNAARYFGDNGGDNLDQYSASLMRYYRGKPNAMVKIYRAVPLIISNSDKIKDLEKQKKYMMKHGKIPNWAVTKLNRSDYYEWIDSELNKLKSNPERENKIVINPGDWVTINRNYAVEHGKTSLKNSYRILTKTVPAKTLFTTADSLHEFGYDPS